MYILLFDVLSAVEEIGISRKRMKFFCFLIVIIGVKGHYIGVTNSNRMPKDTERVRSPTTQNAPADLTQKARRKVNRILARTNWQKYWSDVSEQAEREIDAYDNAYARSLARASKKFVQ